MYIYIYISDPIEFSRLVIQVIFMICEMMMLMYHLMSNDYMGMDQNWVSQ